MRYRSILLMLLLLALPVSQSWAYSNLNCPTDDAIFIIANGPPGLPIAVDVDNDGVWEIATFTDGSWWIDVNRDGVRQEGSIANGDRNFVFGQYGDRAVWGDFNGDGKGEVGVFRAGYWYFDTNNNFRFDPGVDKVVIFGKDGDRPFVGDWNGDGITNVGVLRGNTLIIDSNGNDIMDAEDTGSTQFAQNGDRPVWGDWNGTGVDRVGVYRNGSWLLDLNANFIWDGPQADMVWPMFGADIDQPLFGDWTGDGRTNPGVRRFTTGEYILDTNGDGFLTIGTCDPSTPETPGVFNPNDLQNPYDGSGVCGKDNNLDGEISFVEMMNCDMGICPIESVECEGSSGGDATCPNGGILNVIRDKCQLPATYSCPQGYVYDSLFETCVSEIVCPDGSTWNPNSDLCEMTAGIDCAFPYIWDPVSQSCYMNVNCDPGVYVAQRKRCETEAAVNCPLGYEYYAASQRCEAMPLCPPPSLYNTVTDRCEEPAENTCPEPYYFSADHGQCIAEPDCNPGILNTVLDRCEIVADVACPQGWSPSADGRCQKDPECPGLYSAYSPLLKKCVTDPVFNNCPAPDYVWQDARTACIGTGRCTTPGATFLPGTGMCEAAPYWGCPSNFTLTPADAQPPAGLCTQPPSCNFGAWYDLPTNRCKIESQCAIAGTRYIYDDYDDVEYCGTDVIPCEQIYPGSVLINGSCYAKLATPPSIDKCYYQTAPGSTWPQVWYNTYYTPADLNSWVSPGPGSWFYFDNLCIITHYGPTQNMADPNYIGFSPILQHQTFLNYPGGNATHHLRNLSNGRSILTCSSGTPFKDMVNGWGCYEYKGPTGCPAGTVWDSWYQHCIDWDGLRCPSTGYSRAGEYCYSTYTFDQNFTSTTKPFCPVGTTRDTINKVCTLPPSMRCRPHETQDPITGQCYEARYCTYNGTYLPETDECLLRLVFGCDPGYVWDANAGLCTHIPICQAPLSYQANRDRCEVSLTLTCPTDYFESGDICVKSPVCPSANTGYNPDTDRCEKDIEACPSGYLWDENINLCIAEPSCPTSGAVLDMATLTCATPQTTVCPAPFVPDATPGKCVGNPTCPANMIYNQSTDRCEASASNNCEFPYIWSSAFGKCIAPGYCEFAGVVDPTNDLCERSPEALCPTTLSPNTDNTICEATAGCTSSKMTFNTQSGRCEESAPVSCPAPYVYWDSRDTCLRSFSCPTGAPYNTTTNRCEKPSVQSCPEGYADSGTGYCDRLPECSKGGEFSGSYDGCVTDPSVTDCPAGYTWDEERATCVGQPKCIRGTYDVSLKACVTTSGWGCYGSWYENNTVDPGLCFSSVKCDVGSYVTHSSIYPLTNDRCRFIGICKQGAGWFNPDINNTWELAGCYENKNCESVPGTVPGINGECFVPSGASPQLTTGTYPMCYYDITYTPYPLTWPLSYYFSPGTTLTGTAVAPNTWFTYRYQKLVYPASTVYTIKYGWYDGWARFDSNCNLVNYGPNQTSNWAGFKPLGQYQAFRNPNLKVESVNMGSYMGNWYDGAPHVANVTMAGNQNHFTCSTGSYYWKGHICATGMQPRACPPGTVLTEDGEECYSSPICPEGMQWVYSTSSGPTCASVQTVYDVVISASQRNKLYDSSPYCADIGYLFTTYYPGATYEECRKPKGAYCEEPFVMVDGNCVYGGYCESGGVLNAEDGECTLKIVFTGTGTAYCPANYSYRAAIGKCFHDVDCPEPGNYSAIADVCRSNMQILCDAGFTPDSTVCWQTPYCPPGGMINGDYDMCDAGKVLKCPTTGANQEPSNDLCWLPADCAGEGVTIDAGTNYCWAELVVGCPGDYQLVNGQCQEVVKCPAGGQYDPVENTCIMDATLGCAAPGATLSGNICWAQETCQFGTMDYARDKCISDGSKFCAAPWYQDGDMCRIAASCPSGGGLDFSVSKCSAGDDVCGPLALDKTTDMCWENVDCGAPGAVLNKSTEMCETLFGSSCPVGQEDPALGACYAPAQCLPTGTLDTVLDLCTNHREPVCEPGFVFSDTHLTCIADPFCNPGELDLALNKCFADLVFSCPDLFLLDGSTCYRDPPPCLASGLYENPLDLCTIDSGLVCTIAEATLVPDDSVCWVDADCGPGMLDTQRDVCYTDSGVDCGDMPYDPTWQVCYYDVDCGSGVFVPPRNRCEIGASIDCGSMYYNPLTDLCEDYGSCSVDSNYLGLKVFKLDTEIDYCTNPADYSCPDPYSYIGAPVSMCETEVICPEGSVYNPVLDTCGTGEPSVCPLGDFPCGPTSFSDSVFIGCPTGATKTAQNTCEKPGIIITTSGMPTTNYNFYVDPDDPSRLCTNLGLGETSGDNSCVTFQLDWGNVNIMGQMWQAGRWNTVPNAHSLVWHYGGYPIGNMFFAAPSDSVVITGTGAHNASIDANVNGSNQIVLKENGVDVATITFSIGTVTVEGVYQSNTFCSPNTCTSDFTGQKFDPSAPNYQNDGEIDDLGNCMGEIILFNGEAKSCLKAGIKTNFFNCCDAGDSDWLFFQKVCEVESMETAVAVENGFAVYVGDYCETRWPFGCVQKAKTYCVFKSKMARIIHECARPQLEEFAPDGNWGTGDSANCAGFTADQFQVLDLGDCDLSEAFSDIIDNIQINTIQQKVIDGIKLD